jgi:sn-glycerol 3-phosphate transport system ATP-binding protein
MGVTSLYVTHDQVEAMTLGDRLLVLHEGRPAQLATPMEVFSKPADTYVAGFIGAPAMNLLPAALTEGGTALRLDCGPSVPLDSAWAGADGRRIIVGIRPEDLQPGEGGRVLAVELVERLGSESLVHGRIAGSRAVGNETLVVKLPGPVGASETIPVRLPAARLHVFDGDTGRRLEPIPREKTTPRLAGTNADR